MQLQKTEKARAALLQRGPELNLQDRRLLILSDGQRSVDDIVALLGADARPALLRLLDRGYLIGAARSTASSPPRTGGPQTDPAASRPGSPAPATQLPASQLPAASAAVPASSPRAVRRSLAATKMYLLDMLQLQRDPDAAAICATRSRPAPDRKRWSPPSSTRLRTSSASQRVLRPTRGRRVAEIIPEEALPALHAQCAGTPAAASREH